MWDKTIEHIVEQGSEEWHKIREGKFTSSKINKLMGIKGLGEIGKNYSFELACELFQGRNVNDSFLSYDMQNGIDTEPFAFDQFQLNKDFEFLEARKCGFFELNKDTGSSPDGIISNGYNLEIKCPKPNKLFRLVYDGVIDKEYIDQVQHQMLCTGAENSYFFNYCVFNGEPKFHEIIIPRDQKRIDLMIERIKEAAEVRDEFLERLKKNKQW